jgi:uncharacterized cupin superfamily protein
VGLRKFNLHGELDAWEDQRPGYARRGTRVGDTIGADLIGGSIYELAEGERICPYHYHHGVEEWLYVISGTPTLRTPEGEREVGPGEVVCFPVGPEGAHTVGGPGRVLMLSANRWPSIAVYPDSDKVGPRPTTDYDDPDRLNFRRGDAVDYFEGEQ